MLYADMHKRMADLMNDMLRDHEKPLVTWVEGNEIHCLYQDLMNVKPHERPKTFHVAYEMIEDELAQISHKKVHSAMWNS